jgi:predicted Rossmann fold nucleotide-binding protein DprA/Smf involved in DNA uptake
MTKPTPLEAAIQRTRASLAEATTKVQDLTDQILTLDRERYVARAHVAAYTDALTLMGAGDAVEAPPESGAPRAKPGAVEEAIAAHLANYPDGIKLDGLVERTGQKRASVQAALRRMTDAGKVALDGEMYRIPASDVGTEAPHQEAAE